MASFLEARPFLPIDLPLVRRLTPQGVSLDSEVSLTRGVHTIGGAVWSSLPLTDLGTPTFVLRDGENEFVGQFRHRMGDQHAHIVFIAPDLNLCETEDGWFALLDAMVVAAGKRGALTLNAEVDENSMAFVALRQCGFAIYARQEILKRDPAPLPAATGDLVRPELDSDAFGINALYTSIVPRLVLQADAPPEPGRGFICEVSGRIVAYCSVSEGRSGIFVQSFLHPEMYDQSQAIHSAVLARLPRADRCSVYICVRRYQDWLRGPLTDLGFESWASQAVMVKHTVARITHPILRKVTTLEGAVRVGPPIKMVK